MSKNKFMAGAITAAMVATAIAPVAGAEVNTTAETSFSDVGADYTHFEAINEAVELGFLSGYTDGTFKPLKELTRKDVVKSLGKYVVATSGKELSDFDTSNVVPFNDVTASHGDKELYTYSLIVKQAGIFTGSNNNLMPDNLISRQQMAKVLVNAFDLKDLAGVESKVTDNDKAFSEFVPFINILSENNVTTVENFRPLATAVRGQLASFLVAAHEATTPAPVAPEVASVSAINAKQVEVKFNTAVDASTVVDTDGTLKDGVVTVATISGTSVVVSDASVATLSADGKTLKIDTVSGTFKGQYVVKTVEETVKTTTGEFVPVYTSSVFTAEDTVAPTVSSVEKLNAVTVRVNFSEPLLSAGNWTFMFADGSTASVSPNTANLAKGYVDLTINSGIDAGKLINATILGATDYSSNLISPNPTTFSFSKGSVDGVKPAVQTVTSLGLNKFEVKFSELVQGLEVSDITVNGTPRTANDPTPALAGNEAIITQDATDKTKYTVEVAPLSAGLHTIGLITDAVSDMSGEMNAAFSKVVEFKADTTAPVVTKTEVKTENGAEFLYVNFSESVNEVNVSALAATEVKDFVTVNGTIDLSDLTVVSGTDSKQYKVALSAIEFTPASGSAATIKTGASYTVALTGFSDSSANPLASTSFSFTRAADTDLTKPTVVLTDGESSPQTVDNGVQVVDNDTVRVTFSKALDGASATNKANYSINGLAVKSATLLPGNTVELKLEANTNNLDGLRNVSISGVKSSAGVSMDAFSTTEFFTENVKPTFAASVSAANQITLTFSENVENVIDTDGTAGADQADFTVKVDGVATTATVVEGGTDGTKSYTLTLDRPFTTDEYAKTITVTPTANTDVLDLKGNALSFTSVTVTK